MFAASDSDEDDHLAPAARKIVDEDMADDSKQPTSTIRSINPFTAFRSNNKRRRTNDDDNDDNDDARKKTTRWDGNYGH